MNSIQNTCKISVDLFKQKLLSFFDQQKITDLKTKIVTHENANFLRQHRFQTLAILAVSSGITFYAFRNQLITCLKKLSDDPDSFMGIQQARRNMQESMMVFIEKKQFENQIQNGKINICFLGPVSVGKSTLVNELFNVKQQIGVGQTTQNATIVYENNYKAFWDAPGVHNNWMHYREEQVAFFKSMTKVYLLYSGSVDEIEFMAKLMNRINTPIVLVRTKIDQDKGKKTIEQVLQKDKIKLEEYEIHYEAIVVVGKNYYDQIKQLDDFKSY